MNPAPSKYSKILRIKDMGHIRYRLSMNKKEGTG